MKPITPRQREVAILIASSHSTKEIAGLLNVAVKTVEAHRAVALQRLGLRDVAGLTRWAIKNRLIGC